MKRFLMTVAIGALGVFSVQWQTRGAVLQSPDGSPSHRFEEIADGVYFAIGTGSMTVMSNNLVIINDDHVMLVDSSVSPAAARGLVEGVKTLTDKPVKYVFNTHYHFDHAHGNQIFGDDVEIIGHDFVRTMLKTDVLTQRTNRSFTEGIPAQIDQLQARLSRTEDVAERQRMETQLRIQEATGDFCVGRPGAGGLPYMGDGYVEEWPASLDRLRALDFDIMVPGHGLPFREREQIEHLQGYLRDLSRQVTSLHAEGVSAQDAAGRVDLSAHAEHYGQRVAMVDPRAVLRMYELLQVKMPR